MLFQSTRPCGARLPRNEEGVCNVLFQSTRPCGARRIFTLVLMLPLAFQSTRPCGARLIQRAQQKSCRGVSIHAPVRGATSFCRVYSNGRSSFNPRARAGRD